MTQPIGIDDVLAHARQRFGGTDAEFDYSVSTDTRIGLYRPDGDSRGATGDAMFEINNACYELANADRPEVVPGGGNDLGEREATGRQLRAELAPQIEAYAEQCRAKRYKGWSKWSAGPIEYADQD